MRKVIFLSLFLISQLGKAQLSFQIKGDYSFHHVSAGIPALLENKAVKASCFYNGRFYTLLVFEKLPNELQKERLANAGVRFLEYLPEKTFFVSIDATRLHEIDFINFGIVGMVHRFSTSRMDERLWNPENLPSYAIQGNKIKLHVNYPTDLKASDVTKWAVGFWEILNINETFSRFTVLIPADRIKELANQPWVYYVSPTSPPLETDNLPGRTSHRSNVLSSPLGRNLLGTGVIIGEWDGAGVGTHIDIDSPRVIRFHPYTNNLNGQHATHVAGTMAGAGIIDPFATGMAPEAKVYSWNFMGDIPAQMDSAVRFQNIMLTQNSYGYGPSQDTCKFRGRYDDVSRDLDILVRKYPNLVHVFAAGNSQSECGLGGFRTVFSGFQSAKNNITVGALNSSDAMSSFSSWGPVRDGRLKPEISAVGVNVFSCQNNNLYAGGWNGTSMACPGASGTLAQLYQRYMQINSGNYPDAALIRAIAANTADDKGVVGPDFKFGYGRINGLTAVKTIEQQRYRLDSVSQGQIKVDSVMVGSGLYQFKVALAWTDKEAAMFASKALVNDLDLFVITPVGDTLRPWVCDTMNRNNPATRKIDVMNNLEQVTVDTPVTGYYKIYISGSAVPFGPQQYYYTWEVQPKQLVVTYPNGGESLAPSSSHQIRWDAFGISGTYTIEFSANNGSTWSTVATGLGNAVRDFTWTVPNVITSTARIRITAGSVSDLCDSTFTILGSITGLTGTICSNQVFLAWRPLNGASKYEVMTELNQKMVVIGTTTDTFFTVTGLTNGKRYWFTVRGRTAADTEGPRAVALSFIPNNATLPPTIIKQPNSIAVCSGSSVSFVAKASGTAVNQQWEWSNNGGASFFPISGATDTILTINPVQFAMNGLKYRSRFLNACKGPVYSDTVTLNIDSIIYLQKQPINVTVCDSSSASFSIRVFAYGNPIIQWQEFNGSAWSDLGGATDTVLVVAPVSYSMNNFKYRALVNSSCGAAVTSNIAALTVRSPLSLSLVSGTDTVCSGGTTTLTAIPAGGNSTSRIVTWDNGLGSGVTKTVSPLVTTTYTATVSDSCTGYSVTKSITINALNPLHVSLPPDTLICRGQTVTYTAIATGGDVSKYTFLWSHNLGKGATKALKPSITTTYWVKVIDSCSVFADSSSVTIYVRPAVDLSISASTLSPCRGQTVTITATAIGGDSTYYYYFYENGSLKTQGLNPFYSSTPASSTTYMVIVTDNCTSKTDTDAVNVVIRPDLKITTSGPPKICKGKPATLTANATGGLPSGYAYEWFDAATSNYLGFGSTILVWPSTTASFVCKISDGCSSYEAFDTIKVLVEVADPAFAKTNSGSNWIWFTPSKSGMRSYSWDFGDGKTSTEFMPNHKYQKPGVYTVCLSVQTFTGCDSSICDTVALNFVGGILDEATSEISLYPNPGKHVFYLSGWDIGRDFSFTVWEATGRRIENALLNKESNLLKLELPDLSSGIYLIQLENSSQRAFLRFMVAE